MFPPKKTSTEAAVEGLVASLQRAGLEATAIIQDPANGDWVVRLVSMPPKNGVAPLVSYIKQYLRASGHQASARLSRCRLRITVRPA